MDFYVTNSNTQSALELTDQVFSWKLGARLKMNKLLDF